MPAECIMAIIMVCIKVLNMFFLLHLIIINPIKLIIIDIMLNKSMGNLFVTSI